MKILAVVSLSLLATCAIAGDDVAELKAEMHKECAALFAEGAACADLSSGTRNCVREHLATTGDECKEFEKEHQEFFDAGKNDPIVHK